MSLQDSDQSEPPTPSIDKPERDFENFYSVSEQRLLSPITETAKVKGTESKGKLFGKDKQDELRSYLATTSLYSITNDVLETIRQENKPLTPVTRQEIEKTNRNNQDKMTDTQKEKKSTKKELVDNLLKSEMKKNTSINDLVKEGRADSGKRASPDAGEEKVRPEKNSKKLRVFNGVLSDDLPPLNSKIVRIFTSSTFTGKALLTKNMLHISW